MKRSMVAVLGVAAVLFIAGLAWADQFWGAASSEESANSSTAHDPILFKLDTATGTVGTIYTYSSWRTILDVTCAPGNILYAVHSTTSDANANKTFMLAKVDATTGAVLSDTVINTLTGTDLPAWNALEYHNGKLYAVENCWRQVDPTHHTAWDKRGYIYEVGLNGSGDPTSATLGAYIGGYPAPDGALAYRDGTWYASDWRADAPHASSWIRTTTDIMNTNFTSDLASVHTEPKGYFDGWDFEADGDLLGVSWMASYGLNVYKIDLVTGNPTALYNIGPQLPVHIVSFSGLSALPAVLSAAGARLVQTQNTDGGWGWPLTGSSAMNTLGPIAQGLAKAYLVTRDASMKTALQKAGTLLLSKTNNFSPCDGYLALQLDLVFGGTTYRDHVNTNFYGKLATVPGSYNRNGAGTLYDTAGYVNLIRTSRASQGIPNLAAWDVGMGLVGAASCGVSGSELQLWIAGTKAEIDELNGNYLVSYYDVIGLAGGLYGLAFAKAEFDPSGTNFPGLAACSNLRDMANLLATMQISPSGGFAWNSGYVIPDDGDEAIQETAYAILALAEVDAVAYENEIDAAGTYMKSVQLPTGGWKNYNYVGSTSVENNEITAEGAWGVAVADAAMLVLDATDASLYVKPGESVVIDMNVSRLPTMVKSCQAVLGFSSTYLTAAAGCVAPGSPPVWDEVIYNSWNLPGGGVAGEIDTAIAVYGLTNPGLGTQADGRVAIITLTANGTLGVTQEITQVVFRPDVSDIESTMLSDMDANPVWPTKEDSQTIVIDGVNPLINIASVTQDGLNLLVTGNNAVVGTVDITVTASDAWAGLDGVPAVTVTDSASNTVAVSAVVETAPGSGTFTCTATITSATANGVATINATVSDKSGNSASDSETFNINKHEITGQVELEGFVVATTSREVTFVATGGVKTSWTLTLSFTGGVANYQLDGVPEGTTGLSAKTAWNLRQKLDVSYTDDRAVADFIDTDKLPGGDLNGTNSVNILDYTIMRTRWMTSDPVADIDGSGVVNPTDYTIMKLNWFKAGDAQ